MNRYIAVFLTSIFLAACNNLANKPANGVKLAAAQTQDDAAEYLVFADSYADAPVAKQKQEVAAIQQVLKQNPNDALHRFKLILVYGLSTSHLKDTAKAQSLLQQMLQENMLSGQKLAFAHLLFDQLVELNRASKSSRDAEKRADQALQKNDVLQSKLETMQQKLDELKKIEKAISEREASPK